MQLSIIIVNYKSSHFIVECLRSAMCFESYKNFEWIVVDNDSKDASKETILGEFPFVVWHEMGYNAGFARANAANILAQASFDTANVAWAKGNSANILAQAAFDYANTISGNAASFITFVGARANTAYDKANSANITADSAFARANAANLIANLAFDRANSSVLRAGDFMTGSLDLAGNTSSLGTILSQTGIDLFSQSGSDWTQLNYANVNFVRATQTGAYMSGLDGVIGIVNDAKRIFLSPMPNIQWDYYANGSIRFPDGTLQFTGYPT